jgi:hypothetical protein
MASESGYSNQKKLGTAQFKSIHSVGGDKYGESVSSKALYEKTALAAITVTEVLGNSGQVEFLNVLYTAHLALPNDVVRIVSGNFLNFEFDIISVVNANNFRILPILKASDITGANANVMAWVTNKANSDGSQIVTVAPSPVAYVLNGVDTEVEISTGTPANNKALPALNYIVKDGVQIAINKDTGTPANTVGIPVEIVAASGTPINITAGDINVQLTDMGANFDASRLGDGSGSYASIATNTDTTKALSVKDKDATTVLTSMNGKLASRALGSQVVTSDIGLITNSVIHGLTTGGGGGYVDVKVTPSGSLTTESTITSSALPTGAATSALQGTGNTSLGSIDTKLTSQATAAKQDLLLAELQLKADLTETQPVSVASLPLPTGAATQTTLAALLTELQLKADLTETQPVSIATAIPVAITAGTITSAQVAVGTSAVRATVSGSAPNAARKKLMIKPSKNNIGAIYLGASGVTTSNGLEIIGPDRLEFEFDSGDYYIISDTAAQVCEIIEKV